MEYGIKENVCKKTMFDRVATTKNIHSPRRLPHGGKDNDKRLIRNQARSEVKIPNRFQFQFRLSIGIEVFQENVFHFPILLGVVSDAWKRFVPRKLKHSAFSSEKNKK